MGSVALGIILADLHFVVTALLGSASLFPLLVDMEALDLADLLLLITITALGVRGSNSSMPSQRTSSSHRLRVRGSGGSPNGELVQFYSAPVAI